MTEHDNGPHQAEVDSQTPQPVAKNHGFLEAGEHLIGKTTFEAEHIRNSDGALMVRLLPKSRKEHRFGPGDAILS